MTLYLANNYAMNFGQGMQATRMERKGCSFTLQAGCVKVNLASLDISPLPKALATMCSLKFLPGDSVLGSYHLPLIRHFQYPLCRLRSYHFPASSCPPAAATAPLMYPHELVLYNLLFTAFSVL